MRSAVSVADEILLAVAPPADTAVILRERVHGYRRGPNWTVSIAKLDADRAGRFNRVVSALLRTHPQVDWSNVKSSFGGVRRVARYLPEAKGGLS